MNGIEDNILKSTLYYYISNFLNHMIDSSIDRIQFEK